MYFGWLLCTTQLLIACGSVTAICERFPVSHHGDVSITIYGSPTYFMPSSLYTVNVESLSPFTDFMVTSKGDRSEGSFQVLNDGMTAFADECINTLVAKNHQNKQKIQFLWSVPSSGCVTLRAAVYHGNDWSQANKTICALSENRPSFVEPPPKCCACDHAKYKVVLEGLWSPETHPKDFPTTLWLTHFSDMIGASHSPNFTMWSEGGYASYGFKQLAEYGVVRELETELRNVSMLLRSIIKAAGLWHPNLNGNTSAVFRVDPRRHLLSLASMFGPSPDWIVGVSSLDLCQPDCTWLEEKTVDLYPYDAGTDNGITYMSVNAPNDPQEKIRRITTMYPEDPRAPFYDPSAKEIHTPLARLYIEREKRVPKKCSDLTDMDLIEQASLTENTEEDFRPECSVTKYTEWSQCSVTCGKGLRMRSRSYTNPEKAIQFKCDRQLISKEMCIAESAVCPGEEDEEDEIRRLAEPGECDVTPWSDWSECSVTCDIGFILRTRTFTNSSIMVLKKCMHISTMEKEKCMMPPCQPDSRVSPACKVSEWSEWSPCSVSCGSGTRTRIRHFTVQDPPTSCSSTNLKQTNSCNINKNCKADASEIKELCNLEPDVGPCRGEFKRWVFVSSKKMCIPFNYGGCRGNRNNFETERECIDACTPVSIKDDSDKNEADNSITRKPADCVVSNWSTWSSCWPCPSGYRTKTRTVLVHSQNGGRQCPPLTKAIKCLMPIEFCQ